MLLLTLFLKNGNPEPKKQQHIYDPFLHYPDMNEFLWCKFRCASVLKNKLVFLQSVKYTLASQQYSLVVNYLLYSRNEKTNGVYGKAHLQNHPCVHPFIITNRKRGQTP